jgi:hypothetical protein
MVLCGLVLRLCLLCLESVCADIVSEFQEKFNHCQGKAYQEDRKEEFFDELHICIVFLVVPASIIALIQPRAVLEFRSIVTSERLTAYIIHRAEESELVGFFLLESNAC